MTKRDLLSIADLNGTEILAVLDRARRMKAGERTTPLVGKSIALLFEKPSLRTKASFMVGIQELGGYSFYMGREEVGLGQREPIADVARVLARYVQGIVARVYAHSSVVELAKYAPVPVVNALSDWEHPCQTLADLQTIQEVKGKLAGVTIVFVGDGNNVSRSLALGAALVGARFVLTTPRGYEMDADTLAKARTLAKASGGEVRVVTDPKAAVAGADVVYTDVWTSMGQEEESQKRRQAFRGYTVDEALLATAGPQAVLMHDMPAHYGEEVPPGMLDHPQSVAFDQAENRLHAQKAALEFLLAR